LCGPAERFERHVLAAADRGRVLAIEELKNSISSCALTPDVTVNRLAKRMSRFTNGGAMNALRPALTSMAFIDASPSGSTSTPLAGCWLKWKPLCARKMPLTWIWYGSSTMPLACKT
jgi:hypothetical protein